MSTDLYYEKVNKKDYLGKDLKYILAPILWGHDGTLGGETIHLTLDYTFYDDEYNKMVKMRDFLFGLSKKDGDVGKEAKKLLILLNKNEDGILLSLEG